VVLSLKRGEKVIRGKVKNGRIRTSLKSRGKARTTGLPLITHVGGNGEMEDHEQVGERQSGLMEWEGEALLNKGVRSLATHTKIYKTHLKKVRRHTKTGSHSHAKPELRSGPFYCSAGDREKSPNTA